MRRLFLSIHHALLLKGIRVDHLLARGSFCFLIARGDGGGSQGIRPCKGPP